MILQRFLPSFFGTLFFITAVALPAADVPLPDEVNPAASKAPPKPGPSPSLAAIEDEPGLPRVLLIGDSISIGYTLPVRKLLKGRANVHRIPQNGGSTKNGVANISRWLGSSKWDVIHFNWGIHDLKHMPDGKRQVEPADYEANLRSLVKQMQATGAKLIWATTTPIPAGELNPDRTFGSVPEYNAIAARVTKDYGVLVDDLYTRVLPEISKLQNPKDVHFNRAGSDFLAEAVMESIQAVLPPATGSPK